MRANEFITENEISATTWINSVVKDCQPFLQELKKSNYKLFRGIRALDSPFSINNWGTRQKHYSGQEWNDALSALMRRDGFIATRSEGYFCVAMERSDWTTYDFGRAYVIFPVGDYNMTWYDMSHKGGIPDDIGGHQWREMGYQVIEDIQKKQYGVDVLRGIEYEEYIKIISDPQTVANAFWSTYGKAFSHGTSLEEAGRSGSEVIVNSAKYHAISVSAWEDLSMDDMREFL